MDSNPYNFRHYRINNFAMYINGIQIPPESVSLHMGHENTFVIGHRTLFDSQGIHHSNSRLQIIHDNYIEGIFMLVFHLTPDLAASEGHTSSPVIGHIRLELKFSSFLPDPVVFILPRI